MEPAQYRTAVWVADNAQQEVALRVSLETGKEVPILPQGKFHLAESFHQHYCDPSARRNEWKSSPKQPAGAWTVLRNIWGDE